MFGIFMESFVMLKLYTGLKLLLLLSFLSWGYLLIKEREKRVRILLVYVPVIILGLFLFPVSRKLFVAAGRPITVSFGPFPWESSPAMEPAVFLHSTEGLGWWFLPG